MAASSIATRRALVSLILDRDQYECATLAIGPARTCVWIATANVKQLLVQAPVGTRDRARGHYVPILDTLQSLTDRGISVRLLHGALPSRPFPDELAARAARLVKPCFEMRACPADAPQDDRDRRSAALRAGSANLTGAGLGATAEGRRNFEMGILTEDEFMLDAAQERFDRIWRGVECAACKVGGKCPHTIRLQRVHVLDRR